MALVRTYLPTYLPTPDCIAKNRLRFLSSHLFLSYQITSLSAVGLIFSLFILQPSNILYFLAWSVKSAKLLTLRGAVKVILCNGSISNLPIYLPIYLPTYIPTSPPNYLSNCRAKNRLSFLFSFFIFELSNYKLFSSWVEI